MATLPLDIRGTVSLNNKREEEGSVGLIIGLVIVLVVLSAALGAFYWFFRTPPREVPTGAIPPSVVPAAQGGVVGQTVFLAIDETTDTGSLPRAMNRELVRQAFLIAARDELGLSTRDVILREDFPQAPDDRSFPFTMGCDLVGGFHYSLFRGNRNKLLWEDRVAGSADDPQALLILAEKAEALSRGEFKDLLAQLGATGQLPAPRETSEVPKATDDLLWSVDEISVLAGLRRVHAEIREHGESPELLAALAIGYANLGELTDYYHGSMCKGYHARALLYAERLLHRTGQTPWSLWQRAYVRTLVGLHNAAADDVASAKQAAAAAGAKPLPFWSDVIAQFVEGDLAEMRKVAKTPAQQRLAAWLDLEVAAHGNLDQQTSKLVVEFLKSSPECPRALAMLCAIGELDRRREASSAALGVTGGLMRQRLPDVPGLPAATAKRIRDAASVKDVAAEFEFRRAVIADLKRAGAPERDRGEPSLSALGHQFDEMHYIQGLYLLSYLVNGLSVPVDQEVATLARLCAAHPDAGYIRAFSGKKGDLQAAAHSLTRSVQLFAVRTNEYGMLNWIYSQTRSPRMRTWAKIATQHIDLVYSDQIEYLRGAATMNLKSARTYRPYLQELLKISDKLPSTIAVRIALDWPQAEKDAASYERKYAHEPLVTDALAEQYYKLKRYDDAERCAKLVLEAAPSYATYRLLAKVYKSKGDRAQWKATLDKAITLPPEGLEQATIQNEIAVDLLAHKQVKEAVVYADAAAESYSGWSMLTAARCHERLGEWEKSEKLVRAASERYEQRMPEWMYWCLRTQHGDAAAAQEFVQKKIESWGKELRHDQFRTIGYYQLVKGQPDQALASFVRAYDAAGMPLDGILAALTADRLGKKQARDGLLKRVVETKLPAKTAGSQGQARYQELAALLRELVALPKDGKPDLAKVDQVVRGSSRAFGSSIPSFFVGVCFKNRGDVEQAKKFLLACLQTYGWQGPEHALASALLREMKVDIPRADEGSDEADPPEDPYNTQSKDA